MTDLTDADLAELAARGISRAEAERQLSVLRAPRAYVPLDRACTPADGIERIAPEDHPRLLALAAEASSRLSTFIPASGAASRMFKDLLAYAGGAPDKEVQKFLGGLRRFAFATDDLVAAAARGEHKAVIDQVTATFASLPKGLLPFHRGGITAFEEHLVEAAELGIRKLHFTVSPEHLGRFEALRDAEARPGQEITFSTQSPATDTLAVDGEGNPFRDADGGLLLRPAGHGALLPNLERVQGDLVFIKNIDNVAAAHAKAPTYLWVRLLVGRLLELAREADDGRPLRVCGMVPNTGEPGGGPYWVRGRPQIVESAEVDLADPQQKAAFAGATHFNPVFMVCALRDRAGFSYGLDQFVDANAAIITRKSAGGRELVALERPGLWNGGMSGWTTRFVEVPGAVFQPVKTVNDLLRPEHQTV